MNIEDRLKQHFDSEAEQLSPPAGSIDAARQRGSRRRATRFVAGATLAFAIVGGTGIAITVANSGSDGRGDLVAATDTAEHSQRGDDSLATSTPAPRPNVTGDVVAGVTYEWQSVELPEGSEFGGPPVLAYGNGTYVAVIAGYDEVTASQSSRTFVSTNGRQWTEGGRLDLTWTDSVVASGGRFVAIGQHTDGGFAIATSPDGTIWSVTEVQSGRDGHLGTAEVASGNGVTVVAGTLWQEPPTPPIELTDAGIVLVDTGDFELDVRSLDTGETLFTTTLDVIYGGSDGLAVYDENSSELIVSFPFELLDAAYSEGDGTAGITISHEGYVLELNQERFTYELLDSSGNLVQAGSQEDLYLRPRFTLTHPDTGEVVVDIPTEEFERAQERAYRNQEFIDDGPETVVYVSTNGVDWQSTTLDLPNDPVERDVLGVAHVGDQFLLLASYWNQSDHGIRLFRSGDGVTWIDGGDSKIKDLSRVAGVGDTLFAISYGGGTQIVSSRDGVRWAEGPQLGSSVSLQRIVGGETAVAFGSVSPDYAEPVISTIIDGKELTIDGNLGYLSVIDTASGELLTAIYFDPNAEDPPDQIKLSLNGFDIFDESGSLVLQVDDDDLEAVYEEIAPRFDEYIPQPVLYTLVDGEWRTASTGGLEVGWVRSVAIGADGTLVVTGEGPFDGSSSGVTHSIGPDSEVTEATLVGPAIPEGSGPQLIWVGARG